MIDKKELKKLLKKLNGRSFECVKMRTTSNPEEIIVARASVVNVNQNNEIVVLSENRELLRKPVEEVKFGELLSLAGITISYLDGDDMVTYTLYYTDY